MSLNERNVAEVTLSGPLHAKVMKPWRGEDRNPLLKAWRESEATYATDENELPGIFLIGPIAPRTTRTDEAATTMPPETFVSGNR